MISEREPNFPTNNSRFWDPFLDAFWSLDAIFLVLIFECFLGTFPERLFYDFGAQKASKMEALGHQFEDFFSENAKKTIFLKPLTRFRQV